MAASPVGAAGVSLSPAAHPGQMAWGHWRGDDPHKFTNEAAARVKQPGANPTLGSLP